MGLDMFAFTTKVKPQTVVDFQRPDDETRQELYYWRKHPNLHGWMEQLYRSKGGVNPDFNGDTVLLTLADLDALEAAIREEQLPETTGFFFGESRPEEKERDFEFIDAARKAIAQGLTVYYDSWW
jgi:hypothetical protein